MSNYDFDQITDRRNTGSLKWDVAEGELPMWVADMDFQTAPAVREAIEKRAAHGVFGYTDVEEDWYQAYMDWWERRHQFSIKKEWLTFCTGVVPAISSTVRKLTTPGENVLIQTPVYNIFFNSIVNNGRNVVECPLAYDGEQYEMDFEALEEKLSDPQTSLMILCNPHNPVGRIWERKTLARVGELCEKYHVTVLSDEIHCDITRPGTGYLPFAAASETCKNISVTCIAPTKAFNIAGIQTAAVMIPNEALHHKVWRALCGDRGIYKRRRLAGRTPCISFRKPCIHDRLYPKRDSAVESDRGRCDLPSVVGLQCAWMQRERTCRCDSQNDRSLCVGRRAVRKNWRTVFTHQPGMPEKPDRGWL